MCRRNRTGLNAGMGGAHTRRGRASTNDFPVLWRDGLEGIVGHGPIAAAIPTAHPIL
jgi:hypothetical protein